MVVYNIIACKDSHDGIGIDGRVPWDIPWYNDYFNEKTMGSGNNAILLDEKTWINHFDNGNKILPGRDYIIYSQDLNLHYNHDENTFVKSFKYISWGWHPNPQPGEKQDYRRNDIVLDTLVNIKNYDEIWVFGLGVLTERIYCAWRGAIDKLYVTTIRNRNYNCNQRFHIQLLYTKSLGLEDEHITEDGIELIRTVYKAYETN